MYQKTVLPNGVRVVTSRMDHVRSASLILYFRVGSRYESDEQAGISHFLEHMVFKGTERRPDPIMLTQEIEGVGGILNAATSRESTNYWVKVPSAHLARAFDVLADMLRHSTFDPEELEKERFVIIEEIRGILDTPDDLIHDVIDELVWDGQSVGRPVIGSVETVSAITRDDLFTYLRTQYRPDRLVIAAAGDIHHEQVVELAEQYFGDLPASDVNTFVQAEVRQQEPRVRLLTRPTEQAHLCVAVPALPYTDDRRYVQDMIDAVLSSGMSSRLFQEIRERLGLVYEVYGYFREYADVGQGVVYAGTDPARVEQTIEAILREFDKLRREPVPADELERTKELRRGRIVMGLEDSRAVAGWIGSQEAVFGEILTPEEVMARIDAVTAEQIQELATELFRPDVLNLAIVGPYEADSHFRSLLHL
ncbi:pitrilysin family protein [Sphaerobacter sp.]|uniref:M16 family metallopeptidase n=1 Tax=Sphaerobacter sp. TaxID=2099654 RepID=UPI001D58DBDE|nr:pitrilysin family protein [Sphaerobacter sp.]MBX5443890.1 insulinase family protein [Sphaerobacter sp.]